MYMHSERLRRTLFIFTNSGTEVDYKDPFWTRKSKRFRNWERITRITSVCKIKYRNVQAITEQRNKLKPIKNKRTGKWNTKKYIIIIISIQGCRNHSIQWYDSFHDKKNNTKGVDKLVAGGGY